MQEIEFKTLFLGDSSVGKSSIMMRFVQNKFNEHNKATVGTAYMTKKLECGARLVNFQIWDTAGQETFRSLQKLYYLDSNVAILVYDITKKASFESIKSWYEELQSSCDQKKLVVALVGNKSDLIEKEEVAYDDAKIYAKSISAEFIITSAKTGDGVNELFMRLAQILVQKYQENPNIFMKNNKETSKVSLQTGQEIKKRKRCC